MTPEERDLRREVMRQMHSEYFKRKELEESNAIMKYNIKERYTPREALNKISSVESSFIGTRQELGRIIQLIVSNTRY